MQTSKPSAPRRERRRPQVSCTECRRRKQKCNRRKEGPCANCLRRYPPVQCFIQELEESSTTRGSAKSDGRRRDGVSVTPGPAPQTNAGPSGYPAIPLSRILHPMYMQDCLPYHKHTENEDTSPKAHSPPPGFIIGEVPEFDTNIATAQQKLEYFEPESKELLHRLHASQSPRPLGGILTMLNSFNDMPVNTSLRNTELFHFFHHYVAPRLCSIDGGNIPHIFATDILPWQMKSTLMPNIAILMASATQSYGSHLHQSAAVRNSETLIIKNHVLQLVNRFIREDFDVVGNQAIRIVVHLVVIEFFWGNAEGVWPHMEGIKQMLKLCGGLQGMNDPVRMHVLIVTDYELACTFERDLYLMSTKEALAAELPIQESYSEKFRCPLIAYPITFKESRESLELSIAAAEILDNVRFLTLAITDCLLFPELEPIKTSKIQSTAAWLHKQIRAIPELVLDSGTDINDLISDTIRLTALVYTSSIKSLTSMSRNFPPALMERLFSNISLVGLSSWKDIPGIFLWILLVATPSSGDDHRGRFLRKQMACTGMALGLEDFYRGTAYLRAFWAVQKWIEIERMKVEETDT